MFCCQPHYCLLLGAAERPPLLCRGPKSGSGPGALKLGETERRTGGVGGVNKEVVVVVKGGGGS